MTRSSNRVVSIIYWLAWLWQKTAHKKELFFDKLQIRFFPKAYAAATLCRQTACLVVLNMLKVDISWQIDMLACSAHKLPFLSVNQPLPLLVWMEALRAIWQSVCLTWRLELILITLMARESASRLTPCYTALHCCWVCPCHRHSYCLDRQELSWTA